MRAFRLVAVLAVATLLAGSASAVELVLTFEGTGTGTIGTTPFTGAAFTVSATVDSANSLYAPGTPITATVPATITIAEDRRQLHVPADATATKPTEYWASTTWWRPI